jgi:heat shock protein 5
MVAHPYPLLQTNDKGRLSQDDIDRMVKEAAEFADQDEALKKKIESRNAFESTSTKILMQFLRWGN